MPPAAPLSKQSVPSKNSVVEMADVGTRSDPTPSKPPSLSAPDALFYDLFHELIRRYRFDPVGLAQDVLGVKMHPWQAKFLNAVANGETRLSVRSGRGKGKTFVVAVLTVWWMLTRLPQKTVLMAPAAPTLMDGLMPEIKGMIGRLPRGVREAFHVTQDRIELQASTDATVASQSFLTARTGRPENPEALQGVHSANVLVVMDEASGMADTVIDAMYGAMAGANRVLVLISNPTQSGGFFYETHHRLQGRWWTLHVRKEDEAGDPEHFARWEEDLRTRFGEDSIQYQVQVLGEFPKHDENSVLGADLVRSAMGRDVVDPSEVEVWGVDVARFGDDATCLVRRRGREVVEVRTWRGKDLMQTVGVLKHEWDILPIGMRPAVIFVDSIGSGGGVADRLREQNLPVRDVNVSETPAVVSGHADMRTELWFRMKRWFDGRNVRLPAYDDELFGQLVSVRYQYNSAGKTRLESKDNMKKRGLPSPDKADALAMTFVDELVGGSVIPTWKKVLKRGLSMV